MQTSSDDPRADSRPPADLAVVGAGPAGLTAAVTAADQGLAVTVLDASASTGGQYYRSPAPGLGATRPQALHHGWAVYAALCDRFAGHLHSGRIRHCTWHQVWTVERSGADWTLHAVTGPDGEGRSVVTARRLLVATGSYERQLPFPGWTLPGVVGAAGAQAMLKSGLVLPGRRIVVAGSGPLLQAVAHSLARAGAEVPLLVEAAGYGAYARAARVLAANPGKLWEGARHRAALLRSGVRVMSHSAVTAVHGADRVEGVTVSGLDRDWRPVPGSGRRIDCDTLAVGHGLVPQQEFATALGCATRECADGTHAVVLDDQLRTTVPGVWGAGETGGVGGVQLALVEGELAALSIIRAARAEDRAGREDRADRTGRDGRTDRADEGGGAGRPGVLRRRRRRLRAFAEVMGTVHRPGPGWRAWLADDTEVCRCEEVTAGRIGTAVDELGARDSRTVKLLTRAGMGWCQGRICGPAVRELAVPAGESAAAFGSDRRPFVCPLPLSTLAALAPADGEGEAGRQSG